MRNYSIAIDRELRSEINEYITEFLTVSDEVADAAKTVETYIKENIKKVEPTSFADGGGKREISFSLPLFYDNVKVTFFVTNFNFNNITYFQKFSKKHSVDTYCGNIYKNFKGNVFAYCNINYISLGFYPLAKFYEDVHHELNHLLQQYKCGNTYSDSEVYTFVATDIFSIDEIKHNVAEILYLCLPTEQDSFVSSVYSFVKNEFHIDWNYKDIDDCIKDTEAYRRIYRLKFLYNEIINNKDTYKDIILVDKNFKTWNQFEKYVTKSLQRFEKKFAMVVKKCKADFVIYEQFTWTEDSYRKQFYLINS